MIIVFIVMLLITAAISWIWVIGIDKEIEYRKQNTDYKPGEGWLDWDTAHTEGEI